MVYNGLGAARLLFLCHATPAALFQNLMPPLNEKREGLPPSLSCTPPFSGGLFLFTNKNTPATPFYSRHGAVYNLQAAFFNMPAALYHSLNKTGAFSLSCRESSQATSRICGCAAVLVLNSKKCRHSLKFAVITISVFKLLGRTARASCGVAPLHNILKYVISENRQALFHWS